MFADDHRRLRAFRTAEDASSTVLDLLVRESGAVHDRMLELADATRAGRPPERAELAGIAGAVGDLRRLLAYEAGNPGTGLQR